MKNNVWVLSELFYPDQTSTGYIITEIANSLAENNQVNVICGPAEYNSELINPVTELNPNIRLFRVNLSNWDKNRLFSRIIRLVLLTIKIGVMLVRKIQNGDKVIVVTNPAPLLLFVAQLCKWKKFKLVIIVHDVFPENLRAGGMIKGDGFLYKALLYLFNKAYNSANLLIVLGRDMKRILASKTNLKDEQIKIIGNWADTKNIYPLKKSLGGKIKLQFAGNFGRIQGLLELIKAIYRANNSTLIMEFIGDGAVLTRMKDSIRNYELKNVFILPPFNRLEQQRILNDCDICVVSLAQGMSGLGVPSKTYNILAAGKPILFIGDPNSEIDLLIKESNIGWSFPDYGEELVCFLSGLNSGCKEDLKIKGINSRKLAEGKYSKSMIISEFKKVIDPI